MNPSISTTSSNTFQMSASVDTKWSLNQIHTNTHTLFSATSFQSKNLVNLKQKNSNSTKLLNSSDPAAFDTSRPTILLNPNRKQTKSRLFFPISNGNQDPQSSILTSYSSNLNANMSSPSSMKEAGSSKMQQTTEENTAFLERNEMKIGTSNKSISSLTAMDSISTPTTSHLPYSSLTSKFFHWVSEHQGTSDLPPFVQDDPIWNEAFQSTLKQIKSQPTSKHYYQRLFKCIFLLYLKKFLPKTSSHSNSTMSSIQVSSFDPVAVLDQLIQWYEQSHDLIATLMDAPDGYLMLSDMTKALAPVHRNHAKHFLELAHTHSKTAFMLDPGRGHASAQLGWILLAKKDIPMALYFLLRASCSVQPASTIEVLHSYFRRILSPITNETSTSLPSASLALSKLLGHLYTKTSLDETPSLMRALQTPFPLSYSFIAIFLETLLRSHPHAHGFAMNFFWHCLWTYARAHAFLPLCAMSWHLHHLPFTYHDVPAQDQPLAISAFVQLCDYLNTMPQASLHDEEQEEDEDDISTFPDFFTLEGLTCWTSFPPSLSLSTLKSWWRTSPCQGHWVHVSASHCFVATLGPTCTRRLVITDEGGPPVVQMPETLSYVFDTNTLLSRPCWETQLPILVPLVVVMELRGLTHSVHPRTSKYAKKTLEWLQAAHIPLYTSKGYRVSWTWEEAKQPSSADNLILETCSQLIEKSFRIMLVTGDINLRLKAQGWKIPVCQVEDVFRTTSSKDRFQGRKKSQKGRKNNQKAS